MELDQRDHECRAISQLLGWDARRAGAGQAFGVGFWQIVAVDASSRRGCPLHSAHPHPGTAAPSWGTPAALGVPAGSPGLMAGIVLTCACAIIARFDVGPTAALRGPMAIFHKGKRRWLALSLLMMLVLAAAGMILVLFIVRIVVIGKVLASVKGLIAAPDRGCRAQRLGFAFRDVSPGGRRHAGCFRKPGWRQTADLGDRHCSRERGIPGPG